MAYDKYREEIKYYLKEHRNILTNGDLDNKILQVMQIEYLNLITEKLDKILEAIKELKINYNYFIFYFVKQNWFKHLIRPILL